MRIYLVLAGVALLTSPAWADPVRDSLKQVTTCANISAAADRLKCFDAAVPVAQAALTAPDSPETAQATEERSGVLGWFGFTRPVTKPEDFGKPRTPVESSHELRAISSNVVEFAKNSLGRSLFVLDNGQVWKQIDGDTTELSDPPRGETMKVTISVGVFGGYDLAVDGLNATIKVRRVK
jgi:hypothetical protein